jgi:hypothetical protein
MSSEFKRARKMIERSDKTHPHDSVATTTAPKPPAEPIENRPYPQRSNSEIVQAGSPGSKRLSPDWAQRGPFW